MGFYGIDPLVHVYITMENHHVKWENSHHFDWVTLNSYVTNYQRALPTNAEIRQGALSRCRRLDHLSKPSLDSDIPRLPFSWWMASSIMFNP